jgi:hypothetical protein
VRNVKYLALLFILLIASVISGCGNSSNLDETTTPHQIATEIPCPGVKATGISAGMPAYFVYEGPGWEIPVFVEMSSSSKLVLTLTHHERVQLIEGPVCDDLSAWWKVEFTDKTTGWVQIGSNLEKENILYSASFQPFINDAVHREVPENKEVEAQIRYILADIELGGPTVLQYYQEQAAAKPDEPEMKAVYVALELLLETGKSKVLANPRAFQRKPLRGGTSVVDAGTEYVQPGLDILLIPCDGAEKVIETCLKIKK